MMYTALPADVFSEQDQSKRTIRCFEKDGTVITVEVVNDGEGVILAVSSTDPFVYLDPSLKPGTRIILPDLER